MVPGTNIGYLVLVPGTNIGYLVRVCVLVFNLYNHINGYNQMLSQMGEDWNDSLQSKEQIEAKLLSKYEATMRRERAMAYSFSHQVYNRLA